MWSDGNTPALFTSVHHWEWSGWYYKRKRNMLASTGCWCKVQRKEKVVKAEDTTMKYDEVHQWKWPSYPVVSLRGSVCVRLLSLFLSHRLHTDRLAYLSILHFFPSPWSRLLTHIRYPGHWQHLQSGSSHHMQGVRLLLLFFRVSISFFSPWASWGDDDDVDVEMSPEVFTSFEVHSARSFVSFDEDILPMNK